MSLKNLWIDGDQWVVYGERPQCWVGGDAFKLSNLISKGAAGHGREFFDLGSRWVEHRQRILGEHHHERVFNETGGWTKNHPMFGSYPADAGIWDVGDLRKRAGAGQRIKRLTPINEDVLEWLMKTSQETGVTFEIVIDATLKHTPGLSTAITDQAIRQTSEFLRALYLGELEDRGHYPGATVIIEARNEWQAHNLHGTTLHQVNMWAERFRRWEWDGQGDRPWEFSHAPIKNYVCRQFPEAPFIVDNSMDGVNVGREPRNFSEMNMHPTRSGDWWTMEIIKRIDDQIYTMEQFKADARGAPTSFNESKMWVDPEDLPRILGQETVDGRTGATNAAWYHAWSYTSDIGKYNLWLDNCTSPGGVKRFTVHDEKGMQTIYDWPRAETLLEAVLRERFGSSSPEPPSPEPPGPPEPPTPARVDYRPAIDMKYQHVLGRKPEQYDPPGYEYYQDKLENWGWTLQMVEESMLRSEGYAKKYPLKR